jgi:hypothetical protein
MEDGFGTIIYIILTAVVLIITALGRKKKRTADAPAPPVEEKKEFDPFSIFDIETEGSGDELFEETEKVEVTAAPETNELGMIIEEGVSSFKNGVLTPEAEIESIKQDMVTDDPEHQPPENLSKAYEEHQEESKLEKIMKDFDLGKAVIFSEIINKRKF